MIDSHAHLSGRFCDDLVVALKNIKKTKLKAVILAAASVEESEENIELVKKYKVLRAAVGIHPQKVDIKNLDSVDEQLEQLDEIIKKYKGLVVAVGETGLDYSEAPEEEENRSKKEQKKLFRGQICLSEKYKLPLIVHARKSMDEVIEILGDYKKVFGVLHCYTGGKKRIKKVMDLGDRWYFGIDGNVTYEVGVEQVVAAIPPERLVLETDSPFLTPVPFRGEKNDPGKVSYIYKKVAEIWKKDLAETEKIIDRNVKRLFSF